jgi:hypothetical protein
MTTEDSSATPRPGTPGSFDQLVNGYARPGTPDGAPDAPPPGKADAYRRFLGEQGYRFTVDADGDLRFMREGLEFILFTDEEDDQYFRMSLPWVFAPGSPDEWLRGLRTANKVNQKFKAVKAVLYEKSLWLYIESFFEPPENFQSVFDRCLDTLVCARRGFLESVEGEA